MTIKGTWFIITDMSGNPEYDAGLENAVEYKTEKAALKAATTKLSESTQSEVWVWRLSHVVSKPEVDPLIEKVT